MKKLIYAALVLLFTSAIFIACSKQENEDLNNVNSITVEGIVARDTKTKKTYVKAINDIVSSKKAKESFNKNYEIHSIKTSFTCGEQMPTFSSKQELKTFLLQNRKKTNGFFECYIDDKLIYSVQIIKGEKINEKIISNAKLNGAIPDRFKKRILQKGFSSGASLASLSRMNTANPEYPCTYPGIRKCVSESIHNQNWYEMVKCIAAGFECVAEWYIICIIDNC